MRVIILGATSGIAEATARLYAAEGADLLLVARHPERLEAMRADLVARGASRVETALRDLGQPDGATADFATYVATLGGVDHVLLAYGILGDQTTAERDPVVAQEVLRINLTSPAAWILAAAQVLERQGRGCLVVLGSVAGDRGRRANFVYGATKAGLATLVEGLAHRFAGTGVRCVLVKPGPTVTAMTEGFERKGALWAKPEQIAAIVRRAADKGPVVVYAPWFWRPIMLVIRALPSVVFDRMNL